MWKYGLGVLAILAVTVWYYGSQCQECEGYLNYFLNWKYKWPRCTHEGGCQHYGLAVNPNISKHGMAMRHYDERPVATRMKHW